MPQYDAAIALGTIELTSRIDLRGYKRDQAALISDVNRFSSQLGQQINYGLETSISGLSRNIERQLVTGYANGLRQIEQMMARSPALTGQGLAARQKPQVLGASFGSPQVLAREANAQGRVAGASMGEGVVQGFRASEPLIAASFNKSISGAILATDALKFGLQKMIQGAMGSLPGQIAQVVSGSLKGGGLSEAVNVQLETNTATSTLAALTTLDIGGAAAQIDTLNKRLAESAAALPGATQDYKRLASVLSDNLIGAFKDVSGNLDTDAYVDSLSKISESYGALTASTTRDTGNTALALTRALGGASESQLRQFAFFEQNATALNQINRLLAKAGAESLADLTIEGRVKLLEAVGDTLITQDFKDLAENSVDGLLQSFRSALFDGSTGIFGLNRDLDTALEGTQSVFTSFNEILRGTIGQNADDMGLLFRIVDSAKAAGANIGDPLMAQKTILDAIALSVENAKTKTDAFFQSTGGQALISVYNAVSGVMNSILTNTAELQTAFVAIATVVGGPVGAAVALIATNFERALPIVNEIGAGIYSLFQASVPLVQAFGDTLMGLAEQAMPLLRAGFDSMLAVMQQLQPLAAGIGGGIMSVAGSVGEKVSAIASGAGSSIGGVSLSNPFSSYGGDESGAAPDAVGMSGFGSGAMGELQQGAESLSPILGNIAEIMGAIFGLVGATGALIVGMLPSIQPILEAVTNLASGAIVGISEGIQNIFNGVNENSEGFASAFSGLAEITAALEPGLVALGELMGTIVIQVLDIGAALLNSDVVMNTLVGSAQLLSDIVGGIASFIDANEWVVKIVLIRAAILSIPAIIGGIAAAWAVVVGAIAPVIGAVSFIGTAILSTISLVAGFGGIVGTLAAAWGAVTGAIAGAIALLNPVTLTIAAIAAGVVGIGLVIRALFPQITELWGRFRQGANDAIDKAKENMGSLWKKTEGLRDRFGEVKTKIGEGATKLDQMLGISKRMEVPFQRLRDFANGIKAGLKDALSFLQSMSGKIGELARLVFNGQSAADGGTVDGVFKSGLFTAPESRNGGSSAYHVDTKILRSQSFEQIAAIFDQIAAGYAAMGKEIEFSNSAVSGEIYNVNASTAEKVALLRRAAAAHSHSVSEAYHSFDYYIPDQGKGRRDRSAEGAEILLPQLPGGRVEYASGGNYGNYATIYDAAGQPILKTGHGDDGRALPASQAFEASSGGGSRGGISGFPVPGGLTAEGRRMASLSKNSNVLAALDMIAMAEMGPGLLANNNGFNTGYGGRNIASLRNHPYSGRELAPDGSSSASGRYQFMGDTWAETAEALGLPDFSPASQNIAAIKKLEDRGVLDEIMAGRVEAAYAGLGREWAAFEGNPYGQGTERGLRSQSIPYFRQRQQYYEGGGLPDNGGQRTNTPATQQASGGDTRYGHRRYEQARYVESVGTYGGESVRLEDSTAAAWRAMTQAASATGVNLTAISGFRTNQEQDALWRRQIAQQGSPEAAARISAPPGYSEHHTGRVLDVGDRSNPNTDTQTSFEDTEAFRWMEANADDFGFELSFKKGSTQGAGYEPWHWRHVGTPESASLFGRSQIGGQSQQSGQVRSLSGAGSTGGGTGLDSGEVAEAEFDPSPYLEPSQKAQRDLEATRARLRREGQVMAQERQESDRTLMLEREKRSAELEVQITALAPEDTVGKMLLEFEQNALAIEESVGDRMREADRALEDLNRARVEKVEALRALDLKRKAFDDQMARGQDTAGVTEETLKKEEADISPIDYSSAIAEYEKYKESLQELIDPKLEAQRNTLLNQMDQEIEKAEKLVRATTALNNQYGNTGEYAKYQAQLEGITVAYVEQEKALRNTVLAMDRLIKVEDLSEERMNALVTQRVAADQALEDLPNGMIRAEEELARQYERQIQAGQDKTVDTLMQSRLKLIEAQAKDMQRFDSQGATDLRRRAADMDLAIEAQRTLVQLRNDEVEAVRLLEQAIAIGDEAYVRSQTEIGRGTVEGIRAQASQLEDNARDSLVLQADAIAEQFPTIAEAFEASMADAFHGGVNSGLMQLTEDGDIFGALGTVFNSLFDSVLKQGASKASEWLTGQMFGAGDNEGWLSNLFPDGDSPILTDSEEAAIVLEESAIAAGEHILDAAIEAGAVLDAAGQSTAAAERGPIGMETLPQIWTGRTKEPPKPAAFEELGITLGRTFSRAMPEAGRHLAQPFATTMPSLINRLFDGFSGGGGSSRILDLVGGVLKLFSGGGYVENFAGGGIAAAMQRERAQSGGANPRIAIVNDKEFIIKGSATQALTRKYGSSFLEGLNEGRIEAYAGGGFASRINPVVPSGGYGAAQQVPQARNSTIRADFKTVRIGNMDFVSADQFQQLQAQINEKASASESAQATFDLMRNYPDVRNRLRLD